MNNKCFPFVFLTGLLGCNSADNNPTNSQTGVSIEGEARNVLFILVDDLGVKDLGGGSTLY